MKIVDTIEVVDESLFSVLYDVETTHEFERLFDLWTDPQYLFTFFTNHLNELNHPYWKGITVQQAVELTKNEAQKLVEELLEIAENGKSDRLQTLSHYFQPLGEGIQSKFDKNKAKSIGDKGWLRIYAVRIDLNLFLVSGGAIKLTKKMETTHLQEELEKLEITRQFLLNGEKDEEYKLFELF